MVFRFKELFPFGARRDTDGMVQYSMWKEISPNANLEYVFSLVVLFCIFFTCHSCLVSVAFRFLVFTNTHHFINLSRACPSLLYVKRSYGASSNMVLNTSLGVPWTRLSVCACRES